jgi:hypothetical protein
LTAALEALLAGIDPDEGASVTLLEGQLQNTGKALAILAPADAEPAPAVEEPRLETGPQLFLEVTAKKAAQRRSTFLEPHLGHLSAGFCLSYSDMVRVRVNFLRHFEQAKSY